MSKSSGSPRKASSTSADEDEITLDASDERIIAALRENGRIANRDLADRIGVNEATIRARLRRLADNDIVRVIATRDINAMGFEAIAAVGVQVKGRPVLDVGRDLAALDQVMTVNAAIGMHDLEIQVIARNLVELDRLLTQVIAPIDGVERLFPALALKIVKFNPEWSPL